MGKDYYNILGVSRTATKDEIKKAYRTLAHRYHPDKNNGDDREFKEINEAYQVLGDDQRRQRYDQFESISPPQVPDASTPGFYWTTTGGNTEDLNKEFRRFVKEVEKLWEEIEW